MNALLIMNSKKATLCLMIFYLAALAWIILFKLQFSFKELSHIRNWTVKSLLN